MNLPHRTPTPGRRTLGTAAAVLLGVSVLAGCGGDSYSGEAGSTGAAPAAATKADGPSATAVVNTSLPPLTLDPAVSCGQASAQIVGLLYSQLTQYGTKTGQDGTQSIDPSTIEPYVATKWAASANGKTWTFTLRDGLKFPSGKPIDAAAVKYSIDRVYEMNACGPAYLNSGYKTRNITEVAAPSADTVEFTLRRADPNFPQVLAQMAGSIVDKSVVEAHGGVQADKTNAWMQTHGAGAGAYALTSYEPNKQVVLDAAPGYRLAPAAGAKRLTVNVITADQTLLLQARSGAADLTLGLTKQSANSLKGNGAVQVVSTLSPQQEEINFVHTKKPFDNAKLREALSYAIPYDQILDKAAFGYGELYYGPVGPAFSDYDAADSKPRTYDIAKAKQLIRDSGVKTPIKTTIAVQQTNASELQIATIAQSEWKKLGVDATVKTLSPADFASSIFGFKYPVSIRIGGPAVVDFGYYASYDNTCGHPFNVTNTCDAANDALLIRARAEQDPTRRKALLDEYTRAWVAASPKIPVYADKYVAVLKKGTTGYVYSQNVDYRRLSSAG